VMDEPTASLDLGNRLLVLDRVRRLRGQGYGIVFSTHDPEQAHELATRVAVIAGGRLAAHGTPDEILTGETLSAVYGVVVMVERTPSAVPSSYRQTANRRQNADSCAFLTLSRSNLKRPTGAMQLCEACDRSETE
jgi:ABC-type cobalamin/Fe3+-siderophores transport system ATPase subunit